MKTDDRAALKAGLSGLYFSEDSKERIKRALQEAVTERAAPKRRGKVAFRIALIAAALTLVLGIGVIAEQRQKGLAQRVIPAGAEGSYTGEITKEALFDRALNTIDSFDTASVLFERTTRESGFFAGRIDVNLNTSKAYERLTGENGTDWENFSDGEYLYSYYPGKFKASRVGPAQHRSDEDRVQLETTPRVTFDEQEFGHFIFREGYTNTFLEKYCIQPSQYVVVFLDDPENWEITGETEYLGRACVEVSGVVPYSTHEKYDKGVTAFSMTFDQATGFLLRLSLRGEEGETVESVTVTELTVDDPDFTDARINKALQELFQHGVAEIGVKPVEWTEPDCLADIDKPSQIVKYAKDEDLSQESIYNRMLNSIDYFDTATISFTFRTRSQGAYEEPIINVTVDTDLRSHKAFSTATYADASGGESFIDTISDGVSVVDYYNEDKTKNYVTDSNKRSDLEKEYLAKHPGRHYIGEEDYNMGIDVWVHRLDLSNSNYYDYCIFPEGMAFGYLTDFSAWEITGEKEYLGRTCVVIEGTRGKYAGRYGNTSFCMYVDEATGILLMLEGYDENGNVMNFTHVTEIVIDQPEITCANLQKALSQAREKYADYELIL